MNKLNKKIAEELLNNILEWNGKIPEEEIINYIAKELKIAGLRHTNDYLQDKLKNE